MMHKNQVALKEISIEISNRCLLRCIHCSSGSSPNAYPDELKPEEIVRLIREAAELGATEISFSGGDPVLQLENMTEYMQAAVKQGYTRIMFYTTGVSGLVPDRHAVSVGHGCISSAHLSMWSKWEEFIERVVFIFSLHSYRSDVHDYIMGRTGVWNSTRESISMCVRAGFRVEVHCVPMLPNWRDIPSLLGLCNLLGVSNMSLLRFVPQTRGMVNNRKLALNKDEFAQLQHTMHDLALQNDGCDVRFGCPIDFRHTLGMFSAKQHECHAGMDLILIRPRGEVHPCAAWKSLPEMDNVRDKSLLEIWENGVVFQALREYRNHGWKDIKGTCAMCRYQPSCRSGCPAQRMHALKLQGMRTHDSGLQDLYVDAPDPLCIIGR